MDVEIIEEMNGEKMNILLDNRDITLLRKGGELNNEVETWADTITTRIIKKEKSTIGRTDSDSKERFDDVLNALEEIDAMLWELAGGQKSFEEIKDDYEWERVMRTYEYYDDIRNQYE